MTGTCLARKCRGGRIVCANYGMVTSLALDPIEKKPLNMFYPGSYIVSAGSFGCNLRCPFCQNHDISYGFQKVYRGGMRFISPDELAGVAKEYESRGNIGVAFTYNEPLVGYEYVLDASVKVHENGQKTVLVSNGCVTQEVADLVIPHIDAANIDLKGFTDEYYSKVLKGDRDMVMEFIKRAAGQMHLELTTLIVPGFNDSVEEMRRLSGWVAELDSGRGADTIPLHITRYFPRYKMDVPATDVSLIYELADVASGYLANVFPGNV